GENIITKSIKERKEILSNISFKEPIINSSYKVVNAEQEIIAMFEKSRDIGHEGLVLKDPDSHYHPGKRGRYWVKLKKELDTIDAVVVSAASIVSNSFLSFTQYRPLFPGIRY